MLEDVEKYNHQHIVSWMSDGTGFRVYKPDEFVAKIMPHYFHQTQYRSFQRMLNLYEFQKVLSGANRGSYQHPKFVRSDRERCLEMRIRKRSKKAAALGDGTNHEGKEKAPSKRGAAANSNLASNRLHQQQFEQQLMARGSLSARSNQELSQRRHSLDVLDIFPFHPVISSDIRSMAVQQMHSRLPVANVFGSLSSAPAPSNDADPASIHRHQALRHHNMSMQVAQQDSEKIQVSTHGEQHPTAPTALNFLPASWNTTVYGINHDERVQPSIFGNDAVGDYAAQLKAFEDPSNAFSIAERQHSLFSLSNATMAVSQPHFEQTTLYPQQSSTQKPQQEPATKQNLDESMFDLPLGFDLEPNPFP
jgi:hypothetical protein